MGREQDEPHDLHYEHNASVIQPPPSVSVGWPSWLTCLRSLAPFSALHERHVLIYQDHKYLINISLEVNTENRGKLVDSGPSKGLLGYL